MSMSRKAALLSCAGLISLIAAGPVLAQGPNPVAAPAEPEASSLDGLVVSIRRAEQRAVEAKQKADNQVDALYANDVGKLPDQNVAEAVRRMPGVSVANDQGEGRYVILRGVNPNLANVTLNGASAAVPEPEGRQIKLDDIPSALISKVTVVKSLTPDLDANAIAGQVDIETLSAFDRNKSFVNARAAIGQYDINDAHPYEADISAGGLFGEEKSFGVVVSANISRRPIESQNFGASSPTFGAGGLPSLQEIRDYNLVRERKGATANFDWRPSDSMKLYLRTLYSTFSDNETRDRFRINNLTGNTPTTPTTGTFTNARATAYVRRRQEEDNTRSAQLGGQFTLPIGQLAAEVGYSRAEKEDPLRSEVQFALPAINSFPVTYDISNPLYVFTPGANYFDPTKYSTFSSVNYDRRDAVNTLKQARVDLTMPFKTMGEDSSLKFGLKLQDLEKTNERDYQTYTGGAAAPSLALTSKTGTVTIYDGRYALGPRIDYDAFQAYVTSTPTALAINTSGSVANSLVNDYQASEKVYAAYGMATLHFGPLTVLPGVRIENTKGSYAAKSFTPASSATQGFNIFGDFSYTDVFPGVNVRYDVNEKLVLRGAITTAIGRPNFADLAPYVSVDTSGSGTAAIGNPNLEPLKSINADAALEYYLPGHGVVSVGVFYKDIDKPIFSSITNLTAATTYAGVVLPIGAQITQPTNADSAKVKGIEFNVQTGFDFLPSPFNGLGVSANATFIDADAEGVINRAGKVPLALQSNTVGTVQVFYEKAGFQGRLAWSYRSRYLLGLGTTAAADQYVDNFHQLDARVSYTVSKATLFLEASNLTDEPYRIYLGAKPQVIENERYGTTWRTGLQLAF
jgi:TonB-dependent receptor